MPVTEYEALAFDHLLEVGLGLGEPSPRLEQGAH